MKENKYSIHPDFESLADTYPPLDRETVFMLQEALEPLFLEEDSDPDVLVKQETITTEEGELRALWYIPGTLEGLTPCLIYCHGGGFVMPGSPYQFSLAREYAFKAQCKVLFVDYRLAPQYPFPVAPEDCYSAYCWVSDHAQELDVDKSRIAVAGDSAGGSLATDICLMANDRKRAAPCGQMLLYPVTGVAAQTESRKKYTDTPMCNSKDMEKYEAYYLTNQGSGKWEYASPLEAPSLNGLPPTYIETAEFDCLRDEGILYAERLRLAGVSVELINTAGTVHGFDSVFPDSSIVRDCVDRRISFLKRVFSYPPSR